MHNRIHRRQTTRQRRWIRLNPRKKRRQTLAHPLSLRRWQSSQTQPRHSTPNRRRIRRSLPTHIRRSIHLGKRDPRHILFSQQRRPFQRTQRTRHQHNRMLGSQIGRTRQRKRLMCIRWHNHQNQIRGIQCRLNIRGQTVNLRRPRLLNTYQMNHPTIAHGIEHLPEIRQFAKRNTKPLQRQIRSRGKRRITPTQNCNIVRHKASSSPKIKIFGAFFIFLKK